MTAYYSIALDPADRTPLHQLSWNGVRLASRVLKSVRFRGLDRLLTLARRASGTTQPTVVATLPSGGRFCFPAYDTSWQRFFYQDRPYEADLGQLLQAIGDTQFDFLDCGANYGYWSAWMTGLAGERTIVAVEPSPVCHPMIERTRRMNDRPIHLMKCAISDGSTETVTFMVSQNHVASHIATATEPGEGERPVTVPAVSVDAVAARFAMGKSPLLVKLDVEGFEVDAMRGAAEVACGPSLFAYEDHGGDKNSAASRYMFDNGFDVYFVAGSRKLLALATIEEVDALKEEAHEGYNFLSTRSDVWKQRLAERFEIARP